ncbi:hypothetical protein CTAYLR_008579 [Chrysophaeum taylorii]|uniref:Hcy-binding domain-containing protein n=1 Tax=Chrysophaeum taylorii TaxID=2483200 RepID=A0AAD7XMJ0_9STRA|nr:hypothetical protein CTAYLR_008579 [Chrysophaeum taylorii]
MIKILDGGFGHEFKRRHGDEDFFGGARACISEPELVTEVHRAFAEAIESEWSGEKIATTNSFVATPYHVARHKSELDYREVATRAAMCARGCGRVAGCLPPLGECYAPTVADPRVYVEIARALVVRGGASLLLAETLSSSAEALAAVRAAESVDADLWVCFTLADDATSRLRGGEALGSALRAVVEAARRSPARLRGLGINCCAPDAIDAALPTLVGVARYEADMEAIVYGNGFRATTSEWLETVGRPDCATSLRQTTVFDGDLISVESYAREALGWARRGATVVGGCCGITPNHMKAVAREVGRFSRGDPEGALDAVAALTANLVAHDMWFARRHGEELVVPRVLYRALADPREPLEHLLHLPEGSTFSSWFHEIDRSKFNDFFATPTDEPNRLPAFVVHNTCADLFAAFLDVVRPEPLPTTTTTTKAQVLALAMARHDRLGAKSHARRLPVGVLDRVFQALYDPIPPPDWSRGFYFERAAGDNVVVGVGIVTPSGFVVGFEAVF